MSKWIREESDTDKWQDMEIDGERSVRKAGGEATNNNEEKEEVGPWGRSTR